MQIQDSKKAKYANYLPFSSAIALQMNFLPCSSQCRDGGVTLGTAFEPISGGMGTNKTDPFANPRNPLIGSKQSALQSESVYLESESKKKIKMAMDRLIPGLNYF
jgi:hypothetical protein